MAYLEIKNLTKCYQKDIPVLNNINLTIEKNTITSLIGESGKGKTTLLRCLANLEVPNNGSILLDNKEILNKKGICNKDIGFVFQNFNLFPQYTALDNVLLAVNCNLKRKDKLQKEENKINAIKILTDLGLKEQINLYPYQLSGGQKQRVAIARALIKKPSILLFDEPTSALDPKTTTNIAQLIKSLKKKYTIIVVTHDMAFCKSISDKIFSVETGIIKEDENCHYKKEKGLS